MIPRLLSSAIMKDAAGYPVIGVFGPRQSGKTTLVRRLFPAMRYVNLEDPGDREFALRDPKALLHSSDTGLIIDEFQRVPELLSHIQVFVDERKTPGYFVLTGSQQYLMMEKVSQSLAGRISLFTLLPFSLAELAAAGLAGSDPAMLQWKGFFPRIYDAGLDPVRYHANYVETYLERDVRQLKQIADLSRFQAFLRLCAGRVGQVVNLSSLGDDAGISHNTVKSWLGVLEAGHIIRLLAPYHRNFNKQIIKSPKMYFCDSGLLCYFLGIREPADLAFHHAKGPIFENFTILEVVKHFLNQGRTTDCLFWRDRRGKEVDLLIDLGQSRHAVEIKAGTTISCDWFDHLCYYSALDSGCPAENCHVLYGGTESQERSAGHVHPWQALADPGVLAGF